MPHKIFIVILLSFWLISDAVAEDDLKTGYWLYTNLSVGTDKMNPDQSMTYIHSLGYIQGILDGIRTMEMVRFEMMFPRKLLTPEEIKKLSKYFNYKQINIPDSGINVGQLQLIYLKGSKNHPEDLHNSARVCLYAAIVDAFGWKSP